MNEKTGMNVTTSMNVTTRNLTLITALLSALAFSVPASAADPMVGTGGYARQMHKMEMMKMLDADNNHMVTSAEFDDYYGSLFTALDANNDSAVDEKEWVGVKGKTKLDLATGGYSRELRKMKMMGMMDTDGDHKVTKEEFIGFHKATFKVLDKSGDQQLDPQEWLAKQVG
ncbi:MAG TPA: calcium-binding protein [Methylotenera sp.]|jgi:Ca2+-binding EF-hand superfamily protein|nr:calcium-binding protein [Methylotenera sp.]